MFWKKGLSDLLCCRAVKKPPNHPISLHSRNPSCIVAVFRVQQSSMRPWCGKWHTGCYCTHLWLWKCFMKSVNPPVLQQRVPGDSSLTGPFWRLWARKHSIVYLQSAAGAPSATRTLPKQPLSSGGTNKPTFSSHGRQLPPCHGCNTAPCAHVPRLDNSGWQLIGLLRKIQINTCSWKMIGQLLVIVLKY